MRVIDANVLIYHLLGHGGELTERSSALFRRLRSGEESVHLPITALFECVYTCQSSFEVPNDVLAPILKQIIGFREWTSNIDKRLSPRWTYGELRGLSPSPTATTSRSRKTSA